MIEREATIPMSEFFPLEVNARVFEELLLLLKFHSKSSCCGSIIWCVRIIKMEGKQLF